MILVFLLPVTQCRGMVNADVNDVHVSNSQSNNYGNIQSYANPLDAYVSQNTGVASTKPDAYLHKPCPISASCSGMSTPVESYLPIHDAALVGTAQHGLRPVCKTILVCITPPGSIAMNQREPKT